MAYQLAIARSRRHQPGVPAGTRRTAGRLGRTFPNFSYLICTNPRSGSWLLSEALTSTSVAGIPREWFSVLEERDARARWRLDHSTDLSYPDYLRLVAKKSATGNGVSGILAAATINSRSFLNCSA